MLDFLISYILKTKNMDLIKSHAMIVDNTKIGTRKKKKTTNKLTGYHSSLICCLGYKLYENQRSQKKKKN